MSMYNKTLFKVNDAYEAVSIEQKIEKIINSKEPIDETAPIIYTERKHGVQPEYNIRTDRFEIALEAMDKVSKSYQAQREERMKESAEDNKSPEDSQQPNSNQYLPIVTGKQIGRASCRERVSSPV